jgi:hypothetical protein
MFITKQSHSSIIKLRNNEEFISTFILENHIVGDMAGTQLSHQFWINTMLDL